MIVWYKNQKEGEMPDIFKALTTIAAWILWIAAWVTGFSTLIVGIISGNLYTNTGPAPAAYAAWLAVAGFFAIAAVVIMILRKKME
jgi:hypothetical protein